MVSVSATPTRTLGLDYMLTRLVERSGSEQQTAKTEETSYGTHS